MNTRYPRFDPGDRVILTGSLLNQMLTDIERLSRLNFSPDFKISETAAGTNISLVYGLEANTAKILDYATAGGVYKISVGEGTIAIDPTANTAIPQNYETFPATFNAYLENIPELNDSGSHFLPKNSYLLVIPTGGFTTTDNLPVYRVYMGGQIIPFEYFATNGSATYDGKSLSGTSTATGGGGFTAPAGMTVAGTVDCLVCQLDESGLTGNRVMVSTPSFGTGVIVGYTSGGIKIVYAHGGYGETANTKVLAHGTYGAANATAWSFVTDACPVQFDPFWLGYDSGSGNFFMMTRTPTFNARGFLFSVTGEVQTTIATSPC